MKKRSIFTFFAILLNAIFIYGNNEYTVLNTSGLKQTLHDQYGINSSPINNLQSSINTTVADAQSGKETVTAWVELDKVRRDKTVWQEGDKVKYAHLNQQSSKNQQNIGQQLNQSQNNNSQALNFGDITTRVLDILKNSSLWDNIKKSSPIASVAGEFGIFSFDEGYRKDTADFIIKGDYGKGKPTGLGLGIGLALGFSGADLPLDLRDLSEKIVHWKCTWGHVGNTALNAAAFLPVIGVIKYVKKSFIKIPKSLIDEAVHQATTRRQFAKQIMIDLDVPEEILKKSGFPLNDKLTLTCRPEIKGDTLILNDTTIYSRLNRDNQMGIGHRNTQEIFNQLSEYAKLHGFKNLRIIGDRVSGAKPNHIWDWIIDLNTGKWKNNSNRVKITK